MRIVKQSEQGVALISVLLLVAVMSIIALTMLTLTLSGIESAKATTERSRLTWQLIGAESAALVGVQTLAVTTNREVREGVAGFGQPFAVEANGAQILTQIEEASNCFNLNALVGAPDPELQGPIEQNYLDLLAAQGFSDFEAEALLDAVIDWTDDDLLPRISGAEDSYYASLRPPYRTSGTQLADVSELRAIRGYTKEVYAQIRPLVCARQESDPLVFNINTLTPEKAPLLSMAFSGELSLQDAQDLLEQRPLGGWPTLEAFEEAELIQRIAVEERQMELLSIQSSYLVVTGEVLGQTQASAFSFLFFLSDNAPVEMVSRFEGAL